MADDQGGVLVVDDDQDIRETIELILASQGWPTSGARDGQEALDRVHDGPTPRLVLLDLRMPRLNGEAFLDTVHREGSLEGVPVVVLSGDPKGESVATAIGAAGFLAKPIELADLIATVTRFLSPPGNTRHEHESGAIQH